MAHKLTSLFLALVIVAACSVVLPVWVSLRSPEPGNKTFKIKARQYAYTPHRIVVNQGDTVRLRLASQDVIHGFFLENHDIEAFIQPGKLNFRMRHPSSEDPFRPVEEVAFTADRWGKYRYRCSVTCGTLHPFMQGELIVRPNYLFLAGVGGAVGICIAGFVLMMLAVNQAAGAGFQNDRKPWRIDLLNLVPGLKWLVSRPWFRFAVMLPNLGLFWLFILAGFLGSPIGNLNISIVFVWILWWFLLITFMLPLGARIWCLVCPIPFFGDWFQRGSLVSSPVGKRGAFLTRLDGLKKRWPRRLSNIWLQNLFFLLLAIFSAILVTRPVTTAFVLGFLIVLATLLQIIYPKRTFCNHVCPVSGFVGLYSMCSPVEIRSKDSEVCVVCRDNGCIAGNEKGWGCPWLQYPGKMDRNNQCGFCMECIRTCPNDNMTIKARPFCSEIRMKGYDEAWKAFIMIALALVYSVTLLGPWGTVKAWANVTEMGNWWGFSAYAGIVAFSSLGALPGLWAFASWLGQRLAGENEIPVKEVFLRYSYLLVPLGLMAWMAFSVPLFMVNISYILSTISDPFGWGWDLFGTAGLQWKPFLPEIMGYIQIPLLMIGLGYSLKSGYHIAREIYSEPKQAVRSLIPAGITCTGITAVFMRLFVG